MKLSVKAMAIAGALLWGSAVFMVALANMVWPGYGRAFLDVLASVYPGFPVGGGFPGTLASGVYGLADGAVAGAFLAWFYNLAAPQA